MIAALLFGVAPASAGSRIALVIGNSAYQTVPALLSPANDAADLSASLGRLGFEVRRLTDARYAEVQQAVIDFERQAARAELAIVYFSGYGFQIGGENWLIPIDARLAIDLDVVNETIGLKSLIRAASTATRLGLVIVDASRSDPFRARMQSTNLARAVERGLSRAEPPGNVLVAYAARDGTIAGDSPGRNSPYTASLLKYIEKADLEIRFLFANVRDDVVAATSREQQPLVYGSLSKDMVYLSNSTDSSASPENNGASQQRASPPDPQPKANSQTAQTGSGQVGQPCAIDHSLAKDPRIISDVLRVFQTDPYFSNAKQSRAMNHEVVETWGWKTISREQRYRPVRCGVDLVELKTTTRSNNGVEVETTLSSRSERAWLFYEVVSTTGRRIEQLISLELAGFRELRTVGDQRTIKKTFKTTTSYDASTQFRTEIQRCELRDRRPATTIDTRLTGNIDVTNCKEEYLGEPKQPNREYTFTTLTDYGRLGGFNPETCNVKLINASELHPGITGAAIKNCGISDTFYLAKYDFWLRANCKLEVRKAAEFNSRLRGDAFSQDCKPSNYIAGTFFPELDEYLAVDTIDPTDLKVSADVKRVLTSVEAPQ